MNKSKGKIFVGGLSWQTTDEEFEEFFRGFGEVIDSVVMKKEDGSSRGFGFITFADPEVAHEVLNRQIELGGRRVDCKPAIPREQLDPSGGGPRRMGGRGRDLGPRTTKIFVGGLSRDTKKEDFERYFEKYGEIIDAIVMTDRESGISRGFGFITFSDEKSADRVCSQAVHIIDDKQVETKKAIPKDQMGRPRSGFGGAGFANTAYSSPYGASAGGYRRPQQAFAGGFGAPGYGMSNAAFGAYPSSMAAQASSVFSARGMDPSARGMDLYNTYGGQNFMQHADPGVYGGNADVYGGAVRSAPRDNRSSYHPYSRR